MYQKRIQYDLKCIFMFNTHPIYIILLSHIKD